ncbi:MAG: hypothetical protein M1816_006199 [Peltula sp. TS41687]|nr:MAG: hypothetical protein M1816_006199 [Peltula sp. TS41687]
MASKESQLLTSYLLSSGGRGQLATYVTLSQFTELFPRSQRSNPQIAVLYRELQHQRALVADDVARNIAAEVKRGERQRREVVDARRREEGAREEDENYQDANYRERRMEIELFGRGEEEDDGDDRYTATRRKIHTLRSMVVEMERACRDVEEEMAGLEDEAGRVLERIKVTVGRLGEIRQQQQQRRPDGSSKSHNRLPIVDETLGDLRRLEKTCNEMNKGNGSSN